MSKTNNKCRRVKSSLLQAEVYVRYPKCTINKQERKQYVELKDIEASNGVFQKYVTVDYPITPESVNSYADAADYRKNPEVINQAVARTNLGDITDAQKILNSDATQLRNLVKQSQELLARVEAARATAGSTPVGEIKKEGESNNGKTL